MAEPLKNLIHLESIKTSVLLEESTFAIIKGVSSSVGLHTDLLDADVAIVSQTQLPISSQTIGDFISTESKKHSQWSQYLYDLLSAPLQIHNTKKMNQLSLPEQIQFQIIFALARKPKVILIDHIVQVLRPDVRTFLFHECKKFTFGIGSCLIVTNDLEATRGLVDKTYAF